MNQLNFHSLNVLSVSDKVTRFIYSPQVKKKFCDVDLIIGCGDLPYYYLEYALNALDVPLLLVRGNHDKTSETHYGIERVAPRGGIDLHGNVVTRNGWIFSGIEGSIRYSKGRFQYTQTEMWLHVIRLVPKWLMNRALFGRSLDVFVSPAPPRSIHDRESGDGQFATQIVNQLGLLDDAGEYLLLVHPGNKGLFEEVGPNFRFMVEAMPAYSLKETLFLGRRIDAARADIYHTFTFSYPPGLRCRTVVSVYDTTHLMVDAVLCMDL